MSECQTNPAILEMRGIVKRFGATTALDGVHLNACPGEIHALLGENGAGKSTLMHVLAGLTTPDAGEILLDGQTRRLSSPRLARQAGIAMVHQHFTLVPAFTVKENLALDTSPSSTRLNYRAEQAAENALVRADMLGWKLDGRARVMDLPVGSQQRVEIVKALATDARLLIFDEPTAVLAGDEVEELFDVLRRLRAEGRTILLIAHKLAEILAVADRVTVLRRGANVTTVQVADTDAAQLAGWMVQADGTEGETRRRGDKEIGKTTAHWREEKGETQCIVDKEQETPFQPSTAHAPAAFVASELTMRGERGELALRKLSLTVRAGEIVGIGGIDGNGQRELAEALVGLRVGESGSMHWQDQPFTPDTRPRTGYIPQDRRRAGLASGLSIEDNLLFDAVRDPAYHSGPFLHRRRLSQLAIALAGAYDIRAVNLKSPTATLSGGNQQKIVVARALHSNPEWIVAHNPTRGLDIGATRFVHAQLRQAKARGAAIVLISTDLDELAALSDRHFILSHGALHAYHAEDRDPTQIGLLLGGMPTAPRPDAATDTSFHSQPEAKPSA